MKIRIKGNSIRYRLSRPEVELFAKEGLVTEKTEFTNAILTYSILRYTGKMISAELTGQNITIYIPESLAEQWTSTDLVGLEWNMPLSDDKNLYLLIEKDFKCNDATGLEDESELYNNPL